MKMARRIGSISAIFSASLACLRVIGSSFAEIAIFC